MDVLVRRYIKGNENHITSSHDSQDAQKKVKGEKKMIVSAQYSKGSNKENINNSKGSITSNQSITPFETKYIMANC